MADILVTAKVNPDLDGTACILAYADLLTRQGSPADARVYGHPQSEVCYFIDQQGIAVPNFSDDGVGEWQKFVLVDMSSMKGAPQVVKKDQVIEIIDHRAGVEEFPSAKVQNDLIGAAATIVIERYIQAQLLPQSDHAKLLYGAVFHNTLNFLSSNTSSRDRAAIRFLEVNFGLSRSLSEEMFRYSSSRIFADFARAIQEDAKTFSMGGKNIGAYQLILWDFQSGEWSAKIASAVGETDLKIGCRWSYLGVIDLKTNTNYLYCTSREGQAVLSSVLGVKFDQSWAALSPALLRKQIIPLL
jgi:inorganic pyrophosphatase/exopolyphosphatase